MTAPSPAAAERVPGCRANWLRGCRWEARYDVAPDEGILKRARSTWSTTDRALAVSDAQDAATYTYVRDICTRCGATKERKGGADG